MKNYFAQAFENYVRKMLKDVFENIDLVESDIKGIALQIKEVEKEVKLTSDGLDNVESSVDNDLSKAQNTLSDLEYDVERNTENLDSLTDDFRDLKDDVEDQLDDVKETIAELKSALEKLTASQTEKEERGIFGSVSKNVENATIKPVLCQDGVYRWCVVNLWDSVPTGFIYESEAIEDLK